MFRKIPLPPRAVVVAVFLLASFAAIADDDADSAAPHGAESPAAMVATAPRETSPLVPPLKLAVPRKAPEGEGATPRARRAVGPAWGLLFRSGEL